MRHIYIIAMGDFKARAVRYLLTAIAIGVGVALLVALVTVSDATREYVEQTLYRVYPADIMMYSESINIPQHLVDVIKKSPVVESAEGIIIATGVYGGSVVSIVGIPLYAIDYFAIDLSQGRLPIAKGEAAVEESLGVKPGEVITLKIYSGVLGGEKTLEVKVTGVMRSFLRGFVGAFRLNLVVVPLDWLQENLGTGPFINAVLITMKDKNQVRPFYLSLKEHYRDAQVYTQEGLLNTVSQVFNALNAIFAVISAAALITAAITTFAVMSITTNERLREFGLLKAVGISSRDIVLSVVIEVVSIAAVAGVGGMAIGHMGAGLVKQMLVGMGINFNVPIAFKPHYALLALFTSLAVALAGALLPLYKVSKLRPLEILRLWQ
ncbi:MAG: ABC transporter permease [Pyrobaculum sp.]